MSFDERARAAYVNAVRGFVDQGALDVLRPLLRAHPSEFYLRYQYAKLLGDWSDELPPARRARYKREAVAILKPLMKRLRGKSVELRFGFSVNFYYQSEDWRGMYSFGKRFTRVDHRRGSYAIAMGATFLAESQASRAWAAKAVRAWRKYAFADEPSYFAHYCFAKALALAGDSGAARVRLKIAARKARRPIDDWEFADVLEMIGPNPVTQDRSWPSRTTAQRVRSC